MLHHRLRVIKRQRSGVEAHADQWLRTPNQYLNGRVPLDVIKAGEEDRRALDWLIGSMEDRTPI
jgi:uncharacterized protein (DUF2384 family)